MVRIISDNETLFMSNKQKCERRNKLKQLTEASSLDDGLGELFLIELKKYSRNETSSDDEHNYNLKLVQRAKLLGLM